MFEDQTLDHGRRGLLAATAAVLLMPLSLRAQTPLKIGIVGSGNVGSTLGTLWVKAGHPVLFSSRHPEELKSLVDELGPLAKAGTVKEAIAFGDVVFVAVPYTALPQIGEDNRADLKGKIVIDASNAVAGRDGEIVKEVEANGSGITSARLLPGTRLVRGFNASSYRSFAKQAHRTPPLLAIPIAGDDPEALRVATTLVHDAGFDAVAVPLARAGEFGPGRPLPVQELTAPELRARLGLAN